MVCPRCGKDMAVPPGATSANNDETADLATHLHSNQPLSDVGRLATAMENISHIASDVENTFRRMLFMFMLGIGCIVIGLIVCAFVLFLTL